MSLNEAIQWALPQLRAEALARMTSTARVRRPGGTTTVDNIETDGWVDVYSGPFRLAGSDAGSSGSRTKTVGGVEYEVATRTAHFPHDTTGLRDGDLIEVTAGENAGVVLRIIEADWQEQATARRVPVEAVARPEEW